jgi:hypothetical protein
MVTVFLGDDGLDVTGDCQWQCQCQQVLSAHMTEPVWTLLRSLWLDLVWCGSDAGNVRAPTIGFVPRRTKYNAETVKMVGPPFFPVTIAFGSSDAILLHQSAGAVFSEVRGPSPRHQGTPKGRDGVVLKDTGRIALDL